MKIQDINLFQIEVHKNDEIIYSGEVNDAPDNIKQLVCKNTKFDSNKLVIEVE